MDKKILKIVVLITIISLGIGLGAEMIEGKNLKPKPQPIKKVLGGPVRLGYISSSTGGLETNVPYIREIIEPDLNEYADKLGYDTGFEFIILDAEGNAQTHLEQVMYLKSIGVNIFIGGGWSGQAQAALAYVNDNNMLMWSSSSTSPLLAIENDNLYRMCPTDTLQGPAIAEVLRSRGVDAVVVLQRNDGWGYGLYWTMESAFTANGGMIIDHIVYDTWVEDYSDQLYLAETSMANYVDEYGSENVALLLITFEEAAVIAYNAQYYPTIYNVPWFGCDGTALTQRILDEAPEQAAHLHIYSTMAAPTESSKFLDLQARYDELVHLPFGYYTACQYDISWVLASGILEAQSINANNVIPLMDRISYNHFGASGWCQLNSAGDRASANYQIWGYEDLGEGTQILLYGIYDAITGTVNWY